MRARLRTVAPILAAIAALLPRPSSADIICDPQTRRVIVNPGEPPPSIAVEADYPDPCWGLISATFTWHGPTLGTAEFIVKDNHAITPGCPTVIVTHSVTAPLDPQALGCGTVEFVETILEADGSVRGQSSCPIGFVVGVPTGIPDWSDCTASSAGGVVMACPAGDGPTLAARGATVTVVLRSCGVPIPNFPRSEVWLSSVAPGAVGLCAGGIMADGNSDATGTMTIGGAIAGGGWTEGGMRVVVSGVFIPSTLDIRVHSPDITGDLHVDLADVGPFSADLLAQRGFRSDYHPDGVVNLADVGIFSAHLAHVCR